MPRFCRWSFVSVSENLGCCKIRHKNFSSNLAYTVLHVMQFAIQNWKFHAHYHCSVSQTLQRFGSLTCTPALRPVPRLEGQVSMYPRCRFHINSCPFFWISSSTCLRPVQNRTNTSCMLPPFCMLMTRVWSSSFTHTRKFFLLLCQIPRASGQSRAIPEARRRGDTGLSKRK